MALPEFGPDVHEVRRTLWVEEGKIHRVSEYANGVRGIAETPAALIQIDFAPDGTIRLWSETLDDTLPRRNGRVRKSTLAAWATRDEASASEANS